MSPPGPERLTPDAYTDSGSHFQLQIRSMPPGVQVQSGPWVLSAPELWLGRGSECQVHLEDPSRQLSRIQAVLHWRTQGWVFQQWGANPSQVNQRMLERGEECPLQAGDVIHMEPYVLLLTHTLPALPMPIIPEHWNPFEPLEAQTLRPMECPGVDPLQAQRPSPWSMPSDAFRSGFLGAMGLGGLSLEAEVPDGPQAAQDWGRAVRAALEGLLHWVQAGQAVGPQEGPGWIPMPLSERNPFRDCASVDELLQRWGPNATGPYLKPEEAVREVFARVLARIARV